MNAMEFFQQSTGRWRSQRTTHHLAFRRAENGESEIQVEALVVEHPKVIEICQLHQVDPGLAIGGAYVSWQGSMGWDREEENHEGSTVFVLMPDATEPRQGTLLRERGYAEIVPVAGRYHMDDEDGFVLTTEYESMSSIERFWFIGSNLRLRTSTVKRFGGFSTATFCTEFRLGHDSLPSNSNGSDLSNLTPDQIQTLIEPTKYVSSFGW
ncbi:MAG: phycobiliprotein lyase [Leptolyngbyaceae cyanobacterium RU_5_1]|nr:phycobiliprotein lyase [Leptolyngbyaceae cyanobacterium RU_5_1]